MRMPGSQRSLLPAFLRFSDEIADDLRPKRLTSPALIITGMLNCAPPDSKSHWKRPYRGHLKDNFRLKRFVELGIFM
ncbi:hypothetical protein Rahaq2_4882 (plasmid) [Rahnella aquatilis CIP 78.65 = ATCC 33071]|uniref:Uncharacterized protein n=1 Tax=Rahnella aquatilis (strain ATCC 33071 / DSM 4594 / JCM 1683 / NBRC 105701 / NCIMB 13365 / CIP 78.65) TaxID=745277 RepID=H2J202_RAHAC|nr:hypothetical protein Rahaq2_4882 [Rahnella aquatilis CIP 78.65 = ATCC 33071]